MTESRAGTATKYDVVSIGETMLRFSPRIPLRLEQATEFELHIGGSESNTLVGLARLGLRTCWISRLPNHALGRQVGRLIGQQGVDIGHVVWSAEDRLGTYFYEPASPPRVGEVIYDRSDSAFTKLTSQALPLAPLQACCWFHATGITLALGSSLREMMAFARDQAKAFGSKVSFDFNYRSKLWGMDVARAETDHWVRESDLVFFAKRDAIAWLGLESAATDEDVVLGLDRMRAGKTTVITLGERGAIGAEQGRCVAVGTSKVDGAGRLGGGDAFSAGVLYGQLQGWGLERCLRWGNAMAGLKYSIPGDMPIVHLEEGMRLAEKGGAPNNFGVQR